jgi:hypothetical protein
MWNLSGTLICCHPYAFRRNGCIVYGCRVPQIVKMCVDMLYFRFDSPCSVRILNKIVPCHSNLMCHHNLIAADALSSVRVGDEIVIFKSTRGFF